MALSKPPKTKAEIVAEAKRAAAVNVMRRGSLAAEPRIKPNPIDWEHWRNMPVVNLYEAVALSLGKNPETLDSDFFRGDMDIEPELHKRLKVAVSHASAGSLKLLAYGGNGYRNPVSLPHFCEWASGIWPNLPRALDALISTDKHKSRPPHVAADDSATGKRDGTEAYWTMEKINEVLKYKETHTWPDTAKHFGVSRQRIQKREKELVEKEMRLGNEPQHDTWGMRDGKPIKNRGE